MNEIVGTRLRLVIWLVTGTMFMEVLDGNIIATALPEMGNSFGVPAVELNVAISAYLLSLGVFIPVSSWIAERFGIRRVFTSAIFFFTLTSVACGLSSEYGLFIILRALQGVSGALMVPVGRLLVLRHTPQESRMSTMAKLIWPALIAPVLAPPIGGFIVTHSSWHWIFFLNLPLGVAATLLALWLIPSVEATVKKPFDWIGFSICSVGIFTLLTSLERLTIGSSILNVAMLGASLLLLLLSFYHFKNARFPMLDLGLVKIQTFRVAVLGGSISRMAIGSVPFVLPLMFQVGFQNDAMTSGFLLLFVFAGNLIMKTITTQTLQRFGYRQVMLWNGIFTSLSIATFAMISRDTSYAILIPLLFVSGMTRSMQFTCLGTISFSDVPDEKIADANSLFNVVSQVSMAAGVAMGAMAIRLGTVVADKFSFTFVAIEYKVAFLVASLVSLTGLIEVVRLPKLAGDHFLPRR
jgi:EmrB/QacA subfamily drug resistance transporter